MNPEWPHEAFRSSSRLAIGSLFLLLGFAVFAETGGDNRAALAVGLNWLGVPFLLSGWLDLLTSVSPASRKARDRGLVSVFWASVVGFVAGILTFPLVFPTPPGALVTYAWGLLILGFVPCIPSVFGLVVVAHSVIYFVNSDGFNNRTTTLVVLGAALLCVLAALGLGIEMFNRPSLFPIPFSPVWSLAGLTSAGYALIALGSWREATHRKARAVVVTPPVDASDED